RTRRGWALDHQVGHRGGHDQVMRLDGHVLGIDRVESAPDPDLVPGRRAAGALPVGVVAAPDVDTALQRYHLVVDTGLHVHVAPSGLPRPQDGVRDGLARRRVGQAAGHAVAAGRSHEDAAVDVAVDAVAVVVLVVAVGHIGLRRRLAGAPAGGAVAGAGAHAGIERRLDGAGLRGAHVGGIAVAEAAQRGALVERAGAHHQGLAAVAARARDGRAVARAELATERVGQAQIARGRRALAVALAGCAEAGR